MSQSGLALFGGAAVRSLPLPIEVPPPPADDQDPLGTLEAELGALLGGRIAVACAGYEVALQLALRLATENHDRAEVEIALPTVGADAAARAALQLGLRVLPIDVDQDTGNLSARALAANLSARTRVLMVTHLFGHPATMSDLMRLAEHHGITVIEDLHASIGAEYGGSPVGTLGAIAVFGGGAGHLLTPADFGAVAVADEAAAALLRSWRDAAGAPQEAALRVALSELRSAQNALHARRQAAWHLTYELRQVRGVSPMHHGRRIRHGYDRYVVRLRSVLWNRSIEESAAALTAEGVPAHGAIHAMLHEDPDVIARLGEQDPRLEPARFKAAQQLAAEMLAIPLTSETTSRDMNDVAEAIRKIAAASQREENAR